jgi:hypothetical protein
VEVLPELILGHAGQLLEVLQILYISGLQAPFVENPPIMGNVIVGMAQKHAKLPQLVVLELLPVPPLRLLEEIVSLLEDFTIWIRWPDEAIS